MTTLTNVKPECFLLANTHAIKLGVDIWTLMAHCKKDTLIFETVVLQE